MSIANELNQEAWNRWVAYRISIKKPIKPASEDAMKAKLARFGDDQAEVVDQSISNQWQGLFDLKKVVQPGEKPKKTREQVAADSARWEYILREAEKSAQWISSTPMGHLRMLDAVLARLSFQVDDFSYAEKYELLKSMVAEAVARVEAKDVLGDPHARSMVLQLWGEKGVTRLKSRAEKA